MKPHLSRREKPPPVRAPTWLCTPSRLVGLCGEISVNNGMFPRFNQLRCRGQLLGCGGASQQVRVALGRSAGAAQSTDAGTYS